MLTLRRANCSLENAVRGRFSSLVLSFGCLGRRQRGPKIERSRQIEGKNQLKFKTKNIKILLSLSFSVSFYFLHIINDINVLISINSLSQQQNENTCGMQRDFVACSICQLSAQRLMSPVPGRGAVEELVRSSN